MTAGAEVSLELLARIQAGDRAAWDALYLRYRDALLCSIRCRLGAELRAKVQSEDILHSVIRRAMDDVHGFERREQGSLLHWLHVCVLNRIRKEAERWQAEKRAGGVALSQTILEQLPRGADHEPGYLDAERYERLERALARLPGPMREVILLRRIEGLSNADAAAVLGKSEDATSKLHARAVARLASLVGGDEQRRPEDR